MALWKRAWGEPKWWVVSSAGASAKMDGNGLVSMADGVCEMYSIGNECCSDVRSCHRRYCRWWLEFTWHSGFGASWLPRFLDLWVETMVNSHKNALLRGVWINNWAAGEATSSLAANQRPSTSAAASVAAALCCCCASPFPRISLRLCGRDPDWGKAGKRGCSLCPHISPHAECYEVSLYTYMYDYVRIRGVSSRQVLQVLVKVSEKVPGRWGRFCARFQSVTVPDTVLSLGKVLKKSTTRYTAVYCNSFTKELGTLHQFLYLFYGYHLT